MFIPKENQKGEKKYRERETEHTGEEKAQLTRLIDALVYDIENKEKELEQIGKTLYDLEIRKKNLKEDLERLRTEKKRLTQNLEQFEIR